MKKVYACMLSLLLVMGIVIASPTKVSAAGAKTPSGEDTFFFANGTPVKVAATIPEGTPTLVTTADVGFTTFTGTGTDAYVSWVEGSITKYIGIAKTVRVYGGGLGDSNYDTSSITMTSGKVMSLLGGGRCLDSSQRAIVGTANIIMSGGETKNTSGIIGGGTGYTTVNKTNITVTGGHPAMVVGGGAASTSGMPTPLPTFADADNVCIVNEAVIEISGGTIDYLQGGGQGYSLTKKTTITISGNPTVGTVTASGSNGKTLDSTINLENGTIEYILSVVRGTIANSTINISGGTVTYDIYLGNDLGGDTGAVTKSVTLNVTSGTLSGNIYLGGGLSGAETGDASNSTDNCDTITITSPNPVYTAKTATELDNNLSSDTTLIINNGSSLKVSAASTFTNEGSIINKGTLDATLATNGKVSGNGTVTTSGTTSQELDDFKVTLDPNGSTVEKITVINGNTITLVKPAARSGYSFTGWSDGTKTYKGDEVVELTADTIFTAQWAKVVSTADNSNNLLWTILSLSSLIIIGGIIIKKHLSNSQL